MASHQPGVPFEVPLPVLRRFRVLSVEVGGQRHLGVQDDVPVVRHVHDEVGPASLAVGVLCRVVGVLYEVAQFQHPLDLHLTPLAANLRLGKGVSELSRLLFEPPVRLNDVLDLAAQVSGVFRHRLVQRLYLFRQGLHQFSHGPLSGLQVLVGGSKEALALALQCLG